MNLITIAFILILLGALWWLLRLRRETTRDAAKTDSQPRSSTTQYHAVSIRVGKRACKPARDMVGRRFLASAAPKLPLPGCDVLDCDCRFSHHQDRRANRDRRSPFGPGGIGGGTGAYESEQRDGTDRRRDED
jgi:hypothetical protein